MADIAVKNPARWTIYARKARAAIEAMREPTEAMLEESVGHLYAGQPDIRDRIADAWRSMIAAALAD